MAVRMNRERKEKEEPPAEEGDYGGARRPSPTSVGTGGSPNPLSRRMAVLLSGGREDEEQPPAGEGEVGGARPPGPTCHR